MYFFLVVKVMARERNNWSANAPNKTLEVCGKFHRSMSVKIFWKRKVLFGNETFFEGWLDGRSAL